MNFQTIAYILFLILTWAIASALRPREWRQAALLAASYFFYFQWSPHFLTLLLAASLFNYAWGAVLRKSPRTVLLWVGLAGNAALLISCKYSTNLLAFFRTGGDGESLLLPIGVSFYTFQSMSYLIDVYRGYKEKPGWVEFFLYLAFWPTILSGPICRAPEMIPQFQRTARPNRHDLATGSRRIVTGLFMKVVLADTLARGLQSGTGVVFGFDRIEGGWSSLDIWFLCLGYGFQVFFDFAGYTHVAIGSARLFGIRLRENFDDPFTSVSVSQFWSRWHMSLSSWIRDYLFFPLATLRRSRSWRSLAVVVSMIVFGMWHGVGAHFVLWGGYHGLLLVAHRKVQQLRPARPGRQASTWLGDSLGWALTFLLVTCGWVLFRARDLGQAAHMYASLFRPGRQSLLSPDFYWLVALAGGGYFTCSALKRSLARLKASPKIDFLLWLATPVYLATIILLVIVWSEGTSPFVYVRF
ncbi:MAG: MBOAT family O-acyltransferase [Acidobacteriota bacterium]